MDKLQRALEGFYPDAQVIHLERITSGWENEIFAFQVQAGQQPGKNLILRVYPGQDAREKSAREFKAMRQLVQMGYPVPEVYFHDADGATIGKPFVIMARAPGKPIWSLLDVVTPEEKHRLLGRLCQLGARLHQLDWRPFVDDPSIYEAADGMGFIQQWLTISGQMIAQFGFTEFMPALEWIEARKLLIPCFRPSVLHLDFHANNILVDGEAFSIIDWSNIMVGDFRLELAWTTLVMNAYRDTILQEYGVARGEAIEHFDIFEVLACGRYLFSTVASLHFGSDRLGMRPEAVEMMKADKGLNHYVYGRWQALTGLTLSRFESTLL